MPRTGNQRRAHRTGLAAETHAALMLQMKAYRIVARRYRTWVGEIDLIARRRRLVVFVEVKARGTLEEALYATTPRQQARIIAAAKSWLAANPRFAGYSLRFDIIAITGTIWPRHIQNAFDVLSP